MGTHAAKVVGAWNKKMQVIIIRCTKYVYQACMGYIHYMREKYRRPENGNQQRSVPNEVLALHKTHSNIIAQLPTVSL